MNDNTATRIPVFALDIGTHSIIGVVGYSENELFHIEAIEERAHSKRVMIDGQIEDISAVATVAREVKDALETKTGRTLEHVCVAAAGRALRTAGASFELQVPAGGPVSKETVYELEIGAVSKAADDVHASGDDADLFCVGHSVVRYYLDDYVYSTIIDHKGKNARVDIIATFLPSEVVNSLEIAMQKAGMSIDFLTLEPIAAMNAVIPQELRLLNLALVDIGAGTTDIAVCNTGTVTAYTMATVAGDEITEALIKQYLVDFDTAERIKCAIGDKEKSISYQDIMGFEYKLPTEELLESLMPSLEDLACVIADKITEINGKAPQAVFLVGGGGRTPLLCKMVAAKLSLDERKVAIGGNNFMKKIAVGEIEPLEPLGPEYATPLGIAVTAAAAGLYKGFDITVNGEAKHLLRTGKLSMMDVLLLCGYSYAAIMGKSGKSILFEVNGQKRILRGGVLKPASLALNGSGANITAMVSPGDSIHVVEAVAGEDAELCVHDILQGEGGGGFTVLFDNADTCAGHFAIINGARADEACAIHDGDKIELLSICTFAELCEANGGEAQDYLLNGMPAAEDTMLQEGDIIIKYIPRVEAEPAPVQSITYTVEPVSEAENMSGFDVLYDVWPLQADVAEPSASESVSEYIDDIDKMAEDLENPDNLDETGKIDEIAELDDIELNDESVLEDMLKLDAEPSGSVVETEPIHIITEPKLGNTIELKPEPSIIAAEPRAFGDEEDAAPYVGGIATDWQPGEPMFSPEPLLMSSEDFKPLSITLNGHSLTLPPREGGAPYMFLDMLALADIDPSKPQGDIELLLNGRDASFLEKINRADVIEIHWKQR